MRSLTQTFQICATELQVEWRSRRVSTTMLLLATLVVFTVGFAGRGGGGALAPAALWVSVLLAASAGLAQRISQAEASGVEEALLLSSTSRSALYLGRVAAFGLLLWTVALLSAVLSAALFDAQPAQRVGLVGLLGLGALGLAAIGIALAQGLARAVSGAGRLTALLLIPLGLPLLLLGSRGQAALTAGSEADWRALGLLGAADSLLLACGLLLSAHTPSR